jgi:osmotically inducible lipoprotein OsmB
VKNESSPMWIAKQHGGGLTYMNRSFLMNLVTRFPGLNSCAVAAVLVVMAVAVGGCAGMTAQEKGTATGAVIGGVAGNVLCGGLVCTGAGAAVGGVIGHEVTKPK